MKRYQYTSVTVTLLLLIAPHSHADESASWQLERLFQPSQAHLYEEQKDKVFIYDGLYEQDVETALTDQFNRIGNMMFVRTKEIQQGVVVQNDDCD